MKSGPAGNPDRLAHRGDKGWTQPRDDKSDSARRDDDPKRGTIGSNDPDYRAQR